MPDFKPQYLNKPAEGYAEVEELEAVLYELESADIRAHTLLKSIRNKILNFCCIKRSVLRRVLFIHN